MTGTWGGEEGDCCQQQQQLKVWQLEKLWLEGVLPLQAGVVLAAVMLATMVLVVAVMLLAAVLLAGGR